MKIALLLVLAVLIAGCASPSATSDESAITKLTDEHFDNISIVFKAGAIQLQGNYSVTGKEINVNQNNATVTYKFSLGFYSPATEKWETTDSNVTYSLGKMPTGWKIISLNDMDIDEFNAGAAEQIEQAKIQLEYYKKASAGS